MTRLALFIISCRALSSTYLVSTTATLRFPHVSLTHLQRYLARRICKPQIGSSDALKVGEKSATELARAVISALCRHNQISQSGAYVLSDYLLQLSSLCLSPVQCCRHLPGAGFELALPRRLQLDVGEYGARPDREVTVEFRRCLWQLPHLIL
jgi:hypothetical protein